MIHPPPPWQRVNGVSHQQGFRFTKRERITGPEDFRRVMRTGKRLPSRNFVLFIHKGQNPFPRLGIVVKKEVGLATYRNRIRRYLREFFRLRKHQFKEPFDMVVLVKKGCSVQQYREAEEELRGLFFKWHLRGRKS